MTKVQSGVPFDFNPPVSTTFVAPTSAVCVNALWYISLSLSVGVSLVALLGKDWARAYMSGLTGQPYQQARKRQRRWDALEEWRMPQVIMFLPIVLHLALRVAIPVLIVTLAATGVYAVSTALPLMHEHCPYGTPLTQLLLLLVKYFGKLASSLQSYIIKLIEWLGIYVCRVAAPLLAYYQSFRARIGLRPSSSSPEALDLEAREEPTFAGPETEKSQTGEVDLMDSLTSRAVAWLLVNYEDTKSADIALQAIAGANTRLPIEPLEECHAETLLLQKLDYCFATRQKTAKRYLKSTNLLESATLYSRALAVIGYRESLWDSTLAPGGIETHQCLVDQNLELTSWSPSNAAFVLASWAVIAHRYLPATTWAARTVDVLNSHCDDSGPLDREALLTLLKSVSYVLATQELNNTPLLIALVRLRLSLEPSGPWSAAQFNTALLNVSSLRPDTASKRLVSNSHQDTDLESQQSHYVRLLDASRKDPELVPLEFSGLALLELLKVFPQARRRSHLLTINEALRKYSYRPDSLEIQGFVVAQSGYNSRYLTDVVIPRVRPANDGSFADSELVRATYLSVVNRQFLDTLTDSERIEALKLGLVNLESATTNCLKQSCCSLISGFTRCSFFYDENYHLRRGESVTPLLPLFPLLPLLPLLRLTESTDERVLPYAMRALWMITDLIGSSSMSAGEKQSILEPVLSHEPFASGRSKTAVEVCSSPELSREMGCAEVWLSRLENLQGEALRHIDDTDVLRIIIPDAWDIIGFPKSELDSQSVSGRAIAIYRRCRSENNAAGDRSLWPLDDDLAAA
ncbi:hypothetical protein FRC09_003112 [Ceratobasidium sp. 395]|nr:hypothetical protein FRC09_003112 [Ceratobasidium sp. 395]